MTAPEGVGDDFAPQRCKSCEMFVDADGRCIVKRHNGWAASFDVWGPNPDGPWAALYLWSSNGKGDDWR